MPGLLGARPLAPEEEPKGPTETERWMTQVLVWMHMGYHKNEVEPFYGDKGAGPINGPDLDGQLVDESFEHGDSRKGVWPIAGHPNDKTGFMFGPLSPDCTKNHFDRFWNIVAAHIDFWLPFSLTAYIFAPIMGIIMYCMFKGAEFFGVCMDRMFTGASISSALRQMYNGRPDPWAGMAPEDKKS